MTYITAPQLFAGYYKSGPNRCFYCGGHCGDEHKASDHVKDSFTARDTVCGGEWVCPGCISSMDEAATITLASGERREAQKTRGYSWIVANGKVVAATKAHREWLSGQCLTPPDPPFVMCISDSGQKHLLYRAVVCYSRDVVTVTLEGEPVTYRPCELFDRLLLCRKIVAATGKPALSDGVSPRFAMSVISYHDDESLITTWKECCEQPLSRLAAWLCPPKEECANEFPSRATANT